MQKMNQNIGVIVDGYSTGGQLASALKSLGYRVLNIMSTGSIIVEEISSSLNNENFFDTWFYDGDLDSLVARLAELRPQFVATGFESGVPLAETLADRLALPSNDSNKPGYRSNKARMGEGLRDSGVPCAEQIIVSSLSNMTREAVDAIGYPVVVKPTESAGSDSVFIAHTYEGALGHIKTILGKKNRIGRNNTEILVQEFIQGQQYIVNSVSLDGEHFITEIWKDIRTQTINGQVLYDHEHLVDLKDPVSQQLTDYLKACLDALGVRHGPIHAEVILTMKGPLLVEVGARCQGGILGETVCKAIGFSHVTLTAALHSDPNSFIEIVRKISYNPCIMVVSLNSFRSGVVKKTNYQELLQKLPSFSAIMSMPSVGEYVPKTRDLFTSLGAIYLVHDDFNILNSDLATIRSLEKSNSFLQLSES
ncbi:ATP-grasp domain-containing protein [Billgrantia endophytica]|uniref:ATP-grasp domain-containing protein n=1 Tax=Billgrantia endophytica TaxID=2033802 RepID=A0A2N7UE34_9GAMM|nr:ATP-grasp domain-containing protein [Halomonas endophytica]PMR78718.1 hypothetical protein C1H69_00115 [Halomonas endophytica]